MAVYTPVSEASLKQHLAQFDIGGLVSFSGVAEGVSNTNYLVTTTQDKYILTLFESRVREEDLPFCLGFMAYLNAQGIPSPAVVANRLGQRIIPLAGRLSAFTMFLAGAGVKETTVAQCALMGETLARMHLAGKDFFMTRENGMGIVEWKRLVALASLAPSCRGEGRGEGEALEQEIFFLEKNLPRDLPSGAVHADLFPDNVLFEGDRLSGIIDFYFSCTDQFAYDLMLTLNAWCFDKQGRLYKEKSAALLKAYAAVRPMEKKERDALPLFGRAAAVRIAATRLYDLLHQKPGALVTPKDPQEHLDILRFHQNAPEYT